MVIQRTTMETTRRRSLLTDAWCLPLFGLGDATSVCQLFVCLLCNGIKGSYTRRSTSLTAASSDDTFSNHSTSTIVPLENKTTDHENSRAGTNSSTLPIVYEKVKITSLPPHVVNHHIVNMNGRKQLGQGEKIILVGMPKSGTTTVASFFEKSQRYRVCDFICRVPEETANAMDHATRNRNSTESTIVYKRRYIGTCLAKAKARNLPLIKTCGDYDMYGQLDFPGPRIEPCQFPQITMLQDFHQEHPNATFILNLRNASHWTSSVSRWRDMQRRLPKCAMGPGDQSEASLREWYYLHVQRIRHFVTRHPSHALVEIDIELKHTGKRMAAIFGMKQRFWRHHNAQPEEAIEQ